MARKVDRQVIGDFLAEARGYLPLIRQGIEAYGADPTVHEPIEEAYRLAHIIKGAAAMVGLAGLSHIAFHLEDALEDLAAGRLEMNDAAQALLCRTVRQLDDCLDAIGRGTFDEQPLLAEVTQAFRRWRGLPVQAPPAPPETAPAAGADPPCAAEEAPPDATDEAMAPEPAGHGLPDLFENFRAFQERPDEVGAGAVEDGSDAIDGAGPVPAGAPPAEDADDSAEVVPPELVEVFALEAEDHLRNISTLLPALKQQPDKKELLQDIRRSAHTLKGAAATVGLRKLTRLAHRMEDLLDRMYEGGAAATAETIDLLFASTDSLEDLAQDKADAAALRSLFERYDRLLGAAPVAAAASAAAPEADAAEGTSPGTAEAADAAARAAAPRRSGAMVRVSLERLDELVKLVSELVVTRTAFEQRLADYERQIQELQLSAERLRRVSTKLETEYEASTLGGGRVVANRREVAASAGGDGNVSVLASPASWHTLGFDDLEFDRYTGFHLLSRDLAESTTDIHTVGGDLAALAGDFDGYLNRQARLSSDIQDKLMRIRMVPLATLANRLHRAVRTVANQEAKQVELVLEGDDTEVDKAVLEAMADPLLHLLRNAVDHGIEPPELRQARGKPACGRIVLRAFHEGAGVVIQIGDDGGGIDPARVRATAVRGGFVAAGDAERLSEDELLNLLFLPGFSTARVVSEVSGRGVGLDVVKANVHKLKGTLALTSQPGQGATFTIRLPMTLAITRALLVKAHGQTLAIPLSAVTQILRLEAEDQGLVGRESVLRVGGRVYPRVELGKALNLKQPPDETVTRPPVLLLDLGDRQVALVVDQLLGGREIVVKNLGTHVRQLHGVTGVTLLGDGSVVLIVNPAELVRQPVRARAAARPVPAGPARPNHRALTVLVVDDSPTVRRVVSNLIRGAGWTPVAAKDGSEALEVLGHAATPPDLILLDVEMPRMDGYELLAMLKRQAAYAPIPVVMVTSRAGEKHRRKARDLGAAAYVVKPYQDDELLQTIGAVAGQPVWRRAADE
jgi:chemosensory pili system protein ChpA (sensor histidine kinase/response regulator)